MRNFICLVFCLLIVQQSFAQRKYNMRTHQPLRIYMVPVPGGKFDMGDDTSMVDRRPAHTVRLDDFRMSAYEVTQRQWLAVMGYNPSSYQCEDCPVNNVSWEDVQVFITKLNHALGANYRLPTEAEWEFAARGGQLELIHNSDDPHFYGKQFSGRHLPQTIAWYLRNSGDHMHKVGAKQPNEAHIYDMSGNVEEWCNDFYAPTYYTKDPVSNPTGPNGGASHVVRGGSYFSEASELSVTRRAAYLPNTRSVTLGFRLAADAKCKVAVKECCGGKDHK